MTVKKKILSCDSRYIWYGSRYVLFRLLPGSSLAVFPGFLNVYFFFFFFPIRRVFSCLLAWWLNNNLTESEENTYLCMCACLVLYDSWLTAYLKDFLFFLVTPFLVIQHYIFVCLCFSGITLHLSFFSV